MITRKERDDDKNIPFSDVKQAPAEIREEAVHQIRVITKVLLMRRNTESEEKLSELSSFGKKSKASMVVNLIYFDS